METQQSLGKISDIFTLGSAIHCVIGKTGSGKSTFYKQLEKYLPNSKILDLDSYSEHTNFIREIFENKNNIKTFLLELEVSRVSTLLIEEAYLREINKGTNLLQYVNYDNINKGGVKYIIEQPLMVPPYNLARLDCINTIRFLYKLAEVKNINIFVTCTAKQAFSQYETVVSRNLPVQAQHLFSNIIEVASSSRAKLTSNKIKLDKEVRIRREFDVNFLKSRLLTKDNSRYVMFVSD